MLQTAWDTKGHSFCRIPLIDAIGTSESEAKWLRPQSAQGPVHSCELGILRFSESNRCHIVRQGCRERDYFQDASTFFCQLCNLACSHLIAWWGTSSRREYIHQRTLNCNITPNISSILQQRLSSLIAVTVSRRENGSCTAVWGLWSVPNRLGLCLYVACLQTGLTMTSGSDVVVPSIIYFIRNSGAFPSKLE